MISLRMQHCENGVFNVFTPFDNAVKSQSETEHLIIFPNTGRAGVLRQIFLFGNEFQIAFFISYQHWSSPVVIWHQHEIVICGQDIVPI